MEGSYGSEDSLDRCAFLVPGAAGDLADDEAADDAPASEEGAFAMVSNNFDSN
jgi:hypothetical protein